MILIKEVTPVQVNKESIDENQIDSLYYYNLMKYGISKYISNIKSELLLYKLGMNSIPVVVNNPDKDKSCYINSPKNQYINYSREEILKNEKYGKFLKFSAMPGFSLLTMLSDISEFDRCVTINNHLVSTNLWPRISDAEAQMLLERLVRDFPDRAIVFKSVNDYTEASLLSKLKELGCYPVVSRQLFFLDSGNNKIKKKRCNVVDRKLCEKSSSIEIEYPKTLTDEEARRINELYTELYIRKHSLYNPHYNDNYIKMAVESGFLKLQVLKEEGEIIGFQGIQSVNGVITTPFIGYDQSLPQEKGIYRMLSYKLIEEAFNKGDILNMSSGAAQFKMQRGGKPAFEYNLVYDKHLPFKKRLLWKVFYEMSERFIKKGMLKYKS